MSQSVLGYGGKPQPAKKGSSTALQMTMHTKRATEWHGDTKKTACDVIFLAQTFNSAEIRFIVVVTCYCRWCSSCLLSLDF